MLKKECWRLSCLVSSWESNIFYIGNSFPSIIFALMAFAIRPWLSNMLKRYRYEEIKMKEPIYELILTFIRYT